MSFSYEKLWHLTQQKKLNKTQFRDKVGITNSSLSRLSKNKKVSLDTLEKICKCLECNLSEIVEYVDDEANKNGKN